VASISGQHQQQPQQLRDSRACVQQLQALGGHDLAISMKHRPSPLGRSQWWHQHAVSNKLAHTHMACAGNGAASILRVPYILAVCGKHHLCLKQLPVTILLVFIACCV
jgi:hypothetical protein